MRFALTAFIGLLALGGTQARALSGVNNAFNDPHEDGLAKRVSPPPVRPPPVRPPPGRPVGGPKPRPGLPRPLEEPESPALALEQSAAADTSDIVRINCGAAKRGLDFELVFDKRSGDTHSLTWDQWQEVLKEVDQELESDPIFVNEYKGQKVKIIFMGGISSIAFGGRGEGGTTGDGDYSYNTALPEPLRTALRAALDRMIAKNPGKFETIRTRNGDIVDPINNMWDKVATAEQRQALTERSERTNAVAFEGGFISALHGDWAMQLISKIDRIGNFEQGFKEKDQKDAKFFLGKLLEQDPTLTEIPMSTFEEWGVTIGRDASEMRMRVARAAKAVFGQELVGVAQDVKDTVVKYRC